MSDLFLESDRLALYPLTHDDIHDLYVLDNDPRVMEFINGARPVPYEGYPDIVEQWLRTMDTRNGQTGFFKAIHKQDYTFAGWFHLRDGTFFPDELELGYRLKFDFWNRGLATEMSQTLLHYAFNQLNESHVIATTLTRNQRSRRVLEKLNMHPESYFTYPEKLLPFWDEPHRAAVKYVIDNPHHESNPHE